MTHVNVLIAKLPIIKPRLADFTNYILEPPHTAGAIKVIIE